jgi:hypothetical protein
VCPGRTRSRLEKATLAQHEIITRISIYMQKADPRIETHCGGCETCFRFKQCVQIVQYRIGRIDSEAKGHAISQASSQPNTATATVYSLACDLLEPIRPQVDTYLLGWIMREPLRREWFFEQRDGNCRLMGSFAVRLSETTRTWGLAVAPIAEQVSRELWSTVKKPGHMSVPATRLTQNHKREAKGVSAEVHAPEPPKPPRICLGCGASVIYGKNFCSSCGLIVARDELIKSAKRGRIAAQSPEAQARRTETQRRNANAQLAWGKSGQSKISNEVYRNEIEPRLACVTIPTIMSALNVCASYAADIRRGRRRPHARHWLVLAQIAGLANLEKRPAT